MRPTAARQLFAVSGGLGTYLQKLWVHGLEKSTPRMVPRLDTFNSESINPLHIYIYICIWNVYVVCILYNTIYIDRYNLTLEISSVKYQLISTKSTLFRCIVFSWFITQGFSVQGWHCWSWHNPNAFQLYALCCSYLPTVTSSLISLCVDKYSTHGAYELVWTSCMYVHVKSPIHHDTSLFPLLKCQRCGMLHFFGEKNGFQILQVALEIALAHGFGPPVCVSCGCHCDPPARHVLCWAP